MAFLPILLLPGMHGSGDLFDPFIREAPPGLRPIVVSLPQRASYDDLMQSVRPFVPNEPFIVLGESYSGPLALRLGTERGVPALAIVLCNSFIAAPRPPLLRVLPWTLLFRAPPPAAVVRRLLAGRDASPALVSAIRAAVAKTPAHLLAARMRAVLELNESIFDTVTVPLLYLRGTEDVIVPDSAMKRIERVAPRMVRKEIAAPHLLLQTAPKEAWRAITEFLRAASLHTPA